MATRSRSAAAFQRRVGLIITYPYPVPQMDFASHQLHTLKLEAPHPLPETQLEEQVFGSPDQGETDAWPQSGRS